MNKKYWYMLGVLCFFGITLFLSFNRHSRSSYFNYHSEIWGDKAGYYVYLPAALKFGFDATKFPDNIDSKTGNGFRLDINNDKLITKYTCGVAIMQLPFYAAADLLSKPMGFESTGFSPVYHWSINVASVFYLVLGLFFLQRYLEVHFGKSNSLITVLTIFLATNLYYYSIDETGMSHIYSFSLFCMFLYFVQYTNHLKDSRFHTSLIFGLLIGLIVLIRPTNILFLTTFFFLDLSNRSELIARIKRLVNYKIIAVVLIGVLIMVSPQFLYWNYSSGSLLHYSYGNEGFNWFSPKLLHTWLSPNNGLFLYSPFYLLIVGTLFLMIKDKKINGNYILALFLVISYIFSCWWIWGFGCSFGARSYVEYLSVFSIPVAYGIQEVRRSVLGKKVLFCFLVLMFVCYNLKMTYTYDGCFYGKGDWDWGTYINLVISPTK